MSTVVGDIFVTNNTRDFILEPRRSLLQSRWGIIVMTADEVVDPPPEGAWVDLVRRKRGFRW